MRAILWMGWLGVVLVFATRLEADEPAAALESKNQSADSSAGAPSLDLARRIDGLLERAWSEAGVVPAELADDAEFHRRAHLDLTGVIPTAFETRRFLTDESPDKRARLIDRLLEGPAHATHLAALWRKLLLPQDEFVRQFDGAQVFQNRLRDQFARDVRYDNLVADLLVSTGTARQSGTSLFYTALDLKPEELAAATARIFLGVQIQCAQCHDHPYDKWKQSDFWGYAAFFARLQRAPGQRQLDTELVDTDEGEVKLPDTEQVVAPRYLGADPAPEDADLNRRRQLALWMVSRENGYFARAAVNRVWAQMFGRGLVEPLDDLGDHNTPSHPEVLDALAQSFINSGYDLRAVYRALANTRAYQLTGQGAPDGKIAPPEMFARMALKPIPAEQLFDCLVRATRRPTEGAAMDPRALRDPDVRNEFLMLFSNALMGADQHAGIPQVLTLMNGRLVSEITSPDSSRLLAALDAPFLSDEERLEALTLSALGRLPTQEELGDWLALLRGEARPQDRRQALTDLLWAQINSVEFVFNH